MHSKGGAIMKARNLIAVIVVTAMVALMAPTPTHAEFVSLAVGAIIVSSVVAAGVIGDQVRENEENSSENKQATKATDDYSDQDNRIFADRSNRLLPAR
jgi:hypothetical protein